MGKLVREPQAQGGKKKVGLLFIIRLPPGLLPIYYFLYRLPLSTRGILMLIILWEDFEPSTHIWEILAILATFVNIFRRDFDKILFI
jgi:hypothetical protein